MVIESRTVLTSTVSILGLAGQFAQVFFVGKEGVTGDELFIRENIEFIALDNGSGLDTLKQGNYRFTNLNSGSVTENSYDISNIDVTTPPFYGPSGNDTLSGGSYQIVGSINVGGLTDPSGLPFAPYSDSPMDFEIIATVNTTTDLSFNELDASNFINKFFYEKGGSGLALDFTSLSPLPPPASERFIAYSPTVSVAVTTDVEVFFPDPAPIPAGRFSLSNIFYYNRSFSSLNNQKTFSAYSFLQLKNKLNRGFLERKR